MLLLDDIYYVFFFVGIILVLIRLYIDRKIFPRVRIQTWDKEKWPLKFHKGISYIYDRPKAEAVIIFSHGSGGNLRGRANIRELFRNSKLDVGFLMYDYYGYGASDDVNIISESTFTNSIAEIMTLVPNKKIILMGTSLGSYPSCWLAAQNNNNLIGLILCVPFDSFDSFSRLAHYIIGSYDNCSLAKLIKVPTLIIKSEYDTIVPKNSAENLNKLIPNSVLVSVPETHQSYFSDTALDKIMNFISTLL